MNDFDYALIGLMALAAAWAVVLGVLWMARKIPAVAVLRQALLSIAIGMVGLSMFAVIAYIPMALAGIFVSSMFKWVCGLF